MRCFARWQCQYGPQKTASLRQACRTRRTRVGQAPRGRALVRGKRALRSGINLHGYGGETWGMGEHGPAIITSHSTSNSGSSRGFLKKRLTSPIMGSALISSFVSSRLPGMDPSGRARTMNVSSAKRKREAWLDESDEWTTHCPHPPANFLFASMFHWITTSLVMREG
jgi:hypothetical protein